MDVGMRNCHIHVEKAFTAYREEIYRTWLCLLSKNPVCFKYFANYVLKIEHQKCFVNFLVLFTYYLLVYYDFIIYFIVY